MPIEATGTLHGPVARYFVRRNLWGGKQACNLPVHTVTATLITKPNLPDTREL